MWVFLKDRWFFIISNTLKGFLSKPLELSVKSWIICGWEYSWEYGCGSCWEYGTQSISWVTFELKCNELEKG